MPPRAPVGRLAVLAAVLGLLAAGALFHRAPLDATVPAHVNVVAVSTAAAASATLAGVGFTNTLCPSATIVIAPWSCADPVDGLLVREDS